MNSLLKLGWSENTARAWENISHDNCVPGRVVADFGSNYKIAIPQDITAEISGRLKYLLAHYEMPKVGDWVAIQLIDDEHGLVHAVLPRNSEISRKQSGEQFEKQVLAANIDVAFLVQALDQDFSPERMQRYLFQLQKENVKPILVLNKSDKTDDIESYKDKLDSFDAEIIITSALTNKGVDQIAKLIKPGQTAVFLGSSGVGKSTITNLLLGEDRQATQAIREIDSKGRHTTTHRELFILPNGGLVIDTPGIRELQLWGTEEDLSIAFPDIEILIGKCRFSNCTHTSEPDCAVLQATQSGDLDKRRLEAYYKFQKELRYLHTKVDEEAAHQRKQSHKKAQKHYNQILRDEDKYNP